MTFGSVLSRQSPAVSHSWAQKPTSPRLAPLAEETQAPRGPCGASDIVPAARLQAVGAPSTQGCEQKRAVTVVPPDPIGRQNPAQLSVPPSTACMQAVPSG